LGDLTTYPIEVTVNGHRYQVNIETEPLAEEPAGSAVDTDQAPIPTVPAEVQVKEVRAPMPGNILEITVKPGDFVRVRQQLCSLEAMKMKNAIRSPRDGVIASVEVIEDQAVAHGDVLFTYAERSFSGRE
jgi:biotin carboxyl carrier protein